MHDRLSLPFPTLPYSSTLSSLPCCCTTLLLLFLLLLHPINSIDSNLSAFVSILIRSSFSIPLHSPIRPHLLLLDDHHQSSTVYRLSSIVYRLSTLLILNLIFIHKEVHLLPPKPSLLLASIALILHQSLPFLPFTTHHHYFSTPASLNVALPSTVLSTYIKRDRAGLSHRNPYSALPPHHLRQPAFKLHIMRHAL